MSVCLCLAIHVIVYLRVSLGRLWRLPLQWKSVTQNLAILNSREEMQVKAISASFKNKRKNLRVGNVESLVVLTVERENAHCHLERRTPC